MGGNGEMNLPKVPGEGGYHRDPREVRSQVYAGGLCQNTNVDPGGVTVPRADHPGGRIINGPGVGGPGKQGYSKTNGAGEHLREAEEATGPRIQQGWDWDPEPDIYVIQKPQDLAGVQQTPGGVPRHRINTLYIRTHGLCPEEKHGWAKD